jgi:hypothetical protein
MTLKTRLTTAIATGAVLLNALAPLALADTNIQISGNGAFSDSTANVNTSNNTTVTQNNNANISNDVDIHANTGNNDASFNTGGSTSVSTGDANTAVRVDNAVNVNKATVNSCCSNDANVQISGNGAYSDNDVNLRSDNDVRLTQNNNANIRNDVDVHANTGDNNANFNTGGDVSINTGDANTVVGLRTLANANSASIGGGSGNHGTLSARILDNGAFSDNDINLNFDNDSRIRQDNRANIRNDVDVNANTGHNDANFNTGGDVDVVTGDANARVWVDNLANFNAASIDDCGCFSDVLARISGNGAYSDNTIRARFDNDKNIRQDNNARLNNDVDVHADTGRNDAKFNTDGDTSVDTGNTHSNVDLNNNANVNLLNSDGLHDFFHNLLGDLNFTMDPSFLWSWL